MLVIHARDGGKGAGAQDLWKKSWSTKRSSRQESLYPLALRLLLRTSAMLRAQGFS